MSRYEGDKANLMIQQLIINMGILFI